MKIATLTHRIRVIALFLSLIAGSITVYAQSTATDFTVNDCNGVSHHLFAELDAGKVIVFAFVMPCSSCISPALTAYNSAMSYASSHPGRVLFYMADDYANTSCASLTSWASQYGMGSSTKFSHSSVNMLHYGEAAMPKIVVIGGSNHAVFNIQDNDVNGTQVSAAIDQALLATGFDQPDFLATAVKVFPLPAKDFLQIEFDLNSQAAIRFEVLNVLGSQVLNTRSGSYSSGKNLEKLDLRSLNNGIYFLNLISGNHSTQIKFIIQKD